MLMPFKAKGERAKEAAERQQEYPLPPTNEGGHRIIPHLLLLSSHPRPTAAGGRGAPSMGRQVEKPGAQSWCFPMGAGNQGLLRPLSSWGDDEQGADTSPLLSGAAPPPCLLPF